jgi:adenylyltransferase/sulfurtransferase
MTVPDEQAPLSREELRRYARHLVLPEVGRSGQRALREARVLLVGAGGLGSPAALYLASAGIGTLGLVDDDFVDETNLQRQILYGMDDVGHPKVEVARKRILAMNPHVRVRLHRERLGRANALSVLDGYDVVVDGSDNFPTRYLVNDACVLLGKPNVYGAILRWEGHVSVFGTEGGPCYRCIFREPPPPGMVPNCAEAGVLGVLPGIIGSLQTLEVIKLVLRRGDGLAGRLVIFEALDARWREILVPRNPSCPACGDDPAITELIDYEEFCGVASAVEGVDPAALRAVLLEGDAPLLVDVREEFEWQGGNLEEEGAVHIPMGRLEERIHELPDDRDIVIYCQVGARGQRAVQALRAAGLHRVRNLEGGYKAWLASVRSGTA